MAAALRKWKRERGEHGNDPVEPSPKRERKSSPLAPSAENDQVNDEPVINKDYGAKYMKEVKTTFKDGGETYMKFLDLIHVVLRKQVKQVDYAGVGNRIKELFRGHTNLILRFNMFLPAEHRITLPPTEPPEDSVKLQQGIMFKRKVEALGKIEEFRGILALYKKQSHSIDDVYKLAKTLFAGRDDILADFRTFLPPVEGSNSEMLAQEPHQQPTLTSKKVKFVHLSATVRKIEEPGESSRRANIASKDKEKLETTNSKEVTGKRKERTSNRVEEARTKPTQVCQPLILTRHATKRQQEQMAPGNAAAAESPRPASPRPASNQRVSARTAAGRPSLLPKIDTKIPRGPPPPLPSIAELQERMKNLTTCKCRPDCKACEPVEYPIFDWQAEDPEYYAKGKANRKRERQALMERQALREREAQKEQQALMERQALIARGVLGSFNDA